MRKWIKDGNVNFVLFPAPFDSNLKGHLEALGHAGQSGKEVKPRQSRTARMMPTSPLPPSPDFFFAFALHFARAAHPQSALFSRLLENPTEWGIARPGGLAPGATSRAGAALA